MSSRLGDRLRRINQIASLVNSSADPKDVVDRIALAVCQQPPWSTSAIMKVEPDAGYSVLVTRHDPFVASRQPLADRWKLDGSPTRKVLETGKPIVIPDALECEYPGYREEARASDYRTVVLLPLASSPGGSGLVMSVHAQNKVEVDPDELRFLETVAHLAGLAIARVDNIEIQRNLTRRLEHALGVYSMLMSRVMDDVSPAAMAALAADLLGCPVILVDLLGNRATAGAPPAELKISRAAWEELVSVRARRRLCQIALEGGGDTTIEVALPEVRPGLTLTMQVEPVVVDHRTVGGLLLLPGGRKFDNVDMLIVEALRFAVGVQLMRMLVRVGDEAAAFNEFFGRLFDRGWRTPEEIDVRASRLGIAVDRPARLLTLALPDSVRAAERSKILERIQHALARILADGDRRAIVAVHEGDIVLLWTDDDAAADAEPPPDLLMRLQHEVEWIVSAQPILHVGTVCASPEQLRAARADAQRVVALARRIGRSGRIGEAEFDPVARMLATAEPAAIREFVAARLGPIDAHDRAHRTGYLETLRVLVETGVRLQPAADRLGLHISTLRYRLERLRDQFGLDLQDPAQRFGLELALRLRSGLLNEPPAGSDGPDE